MNESNMGLNNFEKRGRSIAGTIVSVIMLAVLGGLCSSCKQQARGTAEDEVQALSFERIELQETSGGLKYSVNMLLPEANTPAAKAIRSELVQMFYATSSELKPQSGESILDFARRQQQAMIADMPEIDNGAEWEWNFTIDILMQAKRYINFAVNGYMYLGGAHGSSFGEGGVTFRLSDGKRITEYFKNPNDPAIRPLLIEGLCQYFNEYEEGANEVTPNNLGDYLMVDPSELQMPAGAPCLTAEGLAIGYSAYEITPYNYGAPSFIIPYEKVTPYLADEVRELIRP